MQIFLVGGAIRDQLLDFPSKEKDWVVVGGTPQDMIDQGFKPVGKDFPVFLHPETGEEYALARTEKKIAHGYKGFTFYTEPNVTLVEDLQRRDLTINAIAQDDKGHLIDPYDGQQDLQKKRLKHVSHAFTEDPVRILRVARFAARYHHLGFSIEATTLELMQSMVKEGETQHLVAERVWQETIKALGERNPHIFFSTLAQCDALKDVYPSLNQDQLQLHLEHLCQMSEKTESKPLRFAALCYSLKYEKIEHLCKQLNIPNQFREMALLISKTATQILKTKALDAYTICNLLQQLDVSRKPERFIQVINAIAWLSQPTASDNMIDFWQTAANHYQQVSPQTLIQQGYTKAALGEAITQQRVQKIDEFINHVT